MPSIKDFAADVGEIPLPVFQSILAVYLEKLAETVDSVNTFNMEVYRLGIEIGESLYFDLLAYLPRSSFKNIKELAELVKDIYIGVTGNRAPFVKVNEDEIILSDSECQICPQIKIGKYKAAKICNFVAGVIDSITGYMGVKTESREIICKSGGAPECVFRIKFSE
ncbi:MAG: hypothetical protein ACTSSJ_01120 [Candidatus Odinarchaeia archaeon]